MRVVSTDDSPRGSLKWLRRAVAVRPDLLQPASLPPIRWVSPLEEDAFAEYRDAAFLGRLGLERLACALADFWPRRGPQWDGLGVAGDAVVLVEAKAHIRELASTCGAGPESRERITMALDATRAALGGAESTEWTAGFYQYANRLAHLHFLRSADVDAHLLMVGFKNDHDVGGPVSESEWRAAYADMEAALGLPRAHPLSPAIHHVFPDVRAL